ncbi:MAG: hypothetical protein RLZ98_3332 [Pseudomonadota bacterium]|jgi:S-adenosylmethionine:tRNA ribosyltransferase-isomerase
MRTDLFDFELPETRIALYPAEPRDAARLLVVQPDGMPELADRTVRDLPELLRPGDALVLNNTRVIPAALSGRRIRGATASTVHFNLTRHVDAATWRAFARPAKRLAVGDLVQFSENGRVCMAGDLSARVLEKLDAGEVVLAFSLSGAYLDEALAALGDMPLPPYIASRRPAGPGDRDTYQTIYAAKDGAVAAPTAGFHMTEQLFAALEERGVSRQFVTLHVGAGTFMPVKAADTGDHVMHSEWCTVSAQTADALNAVRAAGGRIVAVGTTSLRVLESAADENGIIRPFAGDTDIFITPGYRFRGIDLLMTNFHLPRSTLFMLVSAFSGLDAMKRAYAHAIAADYRFYSYGDACLLHPAPDAK